MKIKVFFIIILLIVPASTLANDTFVFDNGHAVYPIKTNRVRMVDEHIKIEFKKRSASVECDFEFENTSDKEIHARLGFPAKADISPGEDPEPPLRKFTSFVNDEQVDVEIKPDKDKPYIFWYTWDVKFGPHEQISLKNAYSTTLSLSYHFNWFEYILITGANWKGPIGKSRIEAIFTDETDARASEVFLCPDGYEIKNNKAVWQLENLIPEENIEIYLPGFDFKRTINDKFLKLFGSRRYIGESRLYDSDWVYRSGTEVAEGLDHMIPYRNSGYCIKQKFEDYLLRHYVRLLRNEIFARHGRLFKSEDLKKFFSSFSWYKADTGYSDEELGWHERKNIETIVEFEKIRGWR